MGGYYDYYPRRSAPLPVSGGIQARSKRGSFGSTWWGRRWMEIFEARDEAGRISRGRSCARGGRVLSIDIEPGRIEAKVQGSRSTPYRVEILLKQWSKDDGARLALKLSPLTLAALLAGGLPPEIEQEAAKLGLCLFPRQRKELKISCSCPDWGDPCKHAAAVCCLVAEEFDRDPLLLLRLRGVERETLLGAVSSPEDTEEERFVALEADAGFWTGAALPQGFWGESGELPPLSKSAPILERLGFFPFWRGENFFEDLRPSYEAAAARGLAAFEGEAEILIHP